MPDPDDYFFKLYFNKASLVEEIKKEKKQQDTATKEGDSVKAVKHGQKVWNGLLKLMKIMEANSIYEIDRYDPTGFDLLYWAATFADELYSVVLKDKFFEKQQLDFYESYVDMHRGMLDKDVRNLGNIRILLAECYFKMGKAEKVDSLFKDWLTVEPEWGDGWIGWSDIYWLWNFGAQKDFGKAEKILIQGLKVTNKANQYDIEKQLKDLKTERKQNVSKIKPKKSKNKFPRQKQNISISQVINNPKLLARRKFGKIIKFNAIDKLEDHEIAQLLESGQKVIIGLKAELKKSKKTIKDCQDDFLPYLYLMRRIKAAKKWHEILKRREFGQVEVELPEETPLLKKLRDAVQFMCFWKGIEYADVCVDAIGNYLPIKEACERHLRLMLRKGKCDLKPTYNFEVTIDGRLQFLSRKQVETSLEKGKFWLSIEKYRLFNNREYYDYK